MSNIRDARRLPANARHCALRGIRRGVRRYKCVIGRGGADPMLDRQEALARILSRTPPQTISWHGPVKLKTSKNPIGSRVAELMVNGVRESWILDTGANHTLERSSEHANESAYSHTHTLAHIALRGAYRAVGELEGW